MSTVNPNSIILETAESITLSTGADQTYQQFADLVQKLVAFDWMAINLLSEDQQLINIRYHVGQKVAENYTPSTRPLSGTQTQHVISTGQTLVRKDIAEEPKFPTDAEILAVGLRSSIMTPLVSCGRSVGVLSLRSRKVGAFGSREQSILERLAGLIAPSLENHNLSLKLLASQEELALVDEVARIITVTLDVEEVYQQFIEELRRVVPFDRAIINIIDQAAGLITRRHRFGTILPLPAPNLPLAGTQAEIILSTGKTLIRDVPDKPELVADQSHIESGMRSTITVPLVSRGKLFGIFGLRSRQQHAYGPREQAILERLALQIAPAVENSLLYEQAKQEMAVVDEIARIITSTLHIDEVYEKFAQEVKKLVDFDRVSVNIVNQASDTFTRKYLFGPPRPGNPMGFARPLEGTQNQEVITTGRTLRRDDTATFPKFPSDLDMPATAMPSSIMVPLISNGRVIGTIAWRARQVGAFGPREQAILERLANQIAPAIENAEFYQQIQATSQEIAVTDEIARIITSTLEIDEVYPKFAERVHELVDFHRFVINVIDHDAGNFVFKYVSGEVRTDRHPGDIIPLEGSQTLHVAQTGTTLVRNDVAADQHFRQFRGDPNFLESGMRSIIMTPLISKGQVVGTMSLRNRRVDAYGSRDQAIMERLALQIAPAIENARLYEETKRTAAALRESEEMFRQMAETIQDVFYVADVKHQRMLYVSPMYEQVWGRTCESLYQDPRSFLESVHPEDRQRIQTFHDEASLERETSVKYRIVLPDKSIRWVWSRTFPIKDESGEVQLRTGVIRDITLQEQAEQELRDSETRNRAFLNALPDLMFRIARDGTYLDFKGAEADTYVSPDNFIGKKIADFMPKDLTRVLMECIDRVLSTGEAETVEYELPIGGEDRTYEARITVSGEDEVLAIARDITEQKRAQQELREREERSRENSRLASVGQLAAGVAHEINNPLAIIQGFGELALGEDLPAHVRGYLQNIHDQTLRTARIVKNLLSFAGSHQTKTTTVAVADILEQALEMKSNQLRLENINVVTQISPETLTVSGDPFQLIEVILNIVTNAQQAMAEVPRQGELIVGARQVENRIIISISDNGVGIAPENLSKVFDPFFTTKDIGKGTGLGLSICHGLVNQHGGEIRAESVQGEGSTFYVELPLSIVNNEVPPPEAESEPTPTVTKLVLVVDDEPGFGKLLTDALETEGHRVELADDGVTAWEMIQHQAYDCLIIDLRMPGMSGKQLYKLIKDKDIELARRCIFVTGAILDPEVAAFLEEVDNPSFYKPLSLQEIRKLVREFG